MFLRMNDASNLQLKLEGGKPGEFQRFFISAKGHGVSREVTLRTQGQEPRRFALQADSPAQLALGLGDNGGPTEYMNLYVRDISSR